MNDRARFDVLVAPRRRDVCLQQQQRRRSLWHRDVDDRRQSRLDAEDGTYDSAWAVSRRDIRHRIKDQHAAGARR
jgi:hypothetical protein